MHSTTTPPSPRLSAPSQDAIDDHRVYEQPRRLRSQRQHNGSAHALADLQLDQRGQVVEITADDLAAVEFAPADEPRRTAADLDELVGRMFRPQDIEP